MKPTRKFNGAAGQKSVDTMGPEALCEDLDKLMKMFDPNALHSDGTQGGISAENFNFSFDDTGSEETPSMAEQIGSREIEGISGTTVGAQLLDIVAKLLDRYTKLETDTLTSEATNNLVESFDVNLTTGVITVTKKDGTIQTWDTALEKVPATFEFVEENGSYYIKVINVDGTSSQTDVTALMNHYTFNNSDDISFSTSGTGAEKTITATIRANSIGLDKLSLTAISTLEGYVNTAEISANKAEEKANTATQKAAEAAESSTNAKASEEAAEASANAAASFETVATQNAETAAQKALESESWAVGGTGTREGEDTNNAKHWCEKAKEIVGGDYATNEKVDAHISDNVKHITPDERASWNETTSEFSTSNLIFNSVQVPTSAFISSDDTDYPYKADINLSEVTANHYVVVDFADTEKYSGIYADYCDSYDGGVTIYSKSIPSGDITIPTIRATKVVE